MYRSVRRGQLSNLVSLCVFLTVIFSAIQLGGADKACLAANIKCVVTDKATGDPIQGAILTLTSGNLKLTEVTDVNGEGTFTGLAPGVYIIKADAQCYDKSKGRKVTLGTGDEERTFNLVAVAEEQKGNLSGNVIDGSTGGIISGATVTIDKGSSVETDVDGSYAFDCVEIGTHNISADADGFVKKTEKGFDVVVDSTLGFALFPPSIKGTVTDADTTEPIPDVLVEAFLDDTTKPPTATDKTNRGGKYALNLTPGTYKIRGSKFGFSPKVSPPVDLGLETEIVNLQLTGCEAALKGKVKDDAGKPIDGAKVEIIELALKTTTDSKGKYEFSLGCLELGVTYTVEAKKPGFETKQEQITVLEKVEKLNFKLPRTAPPIPPTGCPPCEGKSADITFSNITCNSFDFEISGESGPRTENLSEIKRSNRIINKCGTVKFKNSKKTYCVEISVRWGLFCISSVNGRATRVAK